MRTLISSLTLVAALGVVTEVRSEEKTVTSFYTIPVNKLDGSKANLAEYSGKVALVVNTASECGYTPQYAGLEKLYAARKGEGLVVLGFPSNDFGGQEPGTPEQIQTFCRTKYGIQFPMFEKVKTKGAGKHAIYAFLGATHGEPKWNFHKYLVGKDGRVIAAFPSNVAPDSPELKKAIDAALAER
ncbi:glutathione peroxidase [Myxococcota bacterium]|nr:glutathione peroxidase [Myxococcota bacterium]